MGRLLPLLIISLVLGTSVHAAPAGPDTAYIEYMKTTGLWDQLAGMEAQVIAGMKKAPGYDEQRAQPLLRRVSEAYSADRLRFSVATSLQERLKPSDANVFLHWYGTPLGKRLAAAEVEASKPEHLATRADDSANALAALKPTRKARLLRLMKATNMVDGVATISIDSLLGMSRGVALASGKPVESTDAAKARIEMTRAQLAGALQPMLLGATAIVYAPFTDRELDRYIALLESKPGQATGKATTAALDKALTDAAAHLGKGIVGDTPSAPAAEVKA